MDVPEIIMLRGPLGNLKNTSVHGGAPRVSFLLSLVAQSIIIVQIQMPLLWVIGSSLRDHGFQTTN